MVRFARRGRSPVTGAGSPAANDGDVDGRDFLTWQRQYTGSLDSLAAIHTVPEPSSVPSLP